MLPSILGMFAKHPDFGAVKTRLAASIGTEKATECARIMIELLVRRLRGCADARQIVGWPPEALPRFRGISGDGWDIICQEEGDLGRKMARWFESVTMRGSRIAIAIGADCPLINCQMIHDAAKRIRAGADLILGPASDGGFWLIGMKRVPDFLLEKIHWSTESVLSETIELAELRGWNVELVETLTDIDTFEDLHNVAFELAASRERDLRDAGVRLVQLGRTRQ